MATPAGSSQHRLPASPATFSGLGRSQIPRVPAPRSRRQFAQQRAASSVPLSAHTPQEGAAGALQLRERRSCAQGVAAARRPSGENLPVSKIRVGRPIAVVASTAKASGRCSLKLGCAGQSEPAGRLAGSSPPQRAGTRPGSVSRRACRLRFLRSAQAETCQAKASNAASRVRGRLVPANSDRQVVDACVEAIGAEIQNEGRKCAAACSGASETRAGATSWSMHRLSADSRSNGNETFRSRLASLRSQNRCSAAK